MNSSLVSLLLLGLSLSAGAPAPARAPFPAPQSAFTADPAPAGGARISLADGQRMIQNRENHLNPSSLRRDFAREPAAVHGWSFSRKALLAMLDAMKDKSESAQIHFVLGHTEDTDAAGNTLPGTWHETLILFENRPFTLAASDYDYILQHPVLWP